MFRLLFILLFVFPCFGQEMYSFVQHYKVGEVAKYKDDGMWAFDMNGRITESGMVSSKTIKCLGYKDNFLLLEETMVDLVATKKTLDKMSADHETNSLIGIPYTLYVDTLLGTIDHIKTDYKEFEELINSKIRGVGNIDNRVFPFGKNAVDIKIDESWSVPDDTLEIYMGDDESANQMIFSATYKLDKVKNKKGTNIAYITGIHNIYCSLLFAQDSKVFEGSLAGAMKTKYRFDVTNNYTVLSKSSGALKWDFTFEGEAFSAIMEMSEKTKRIK